MSLQISVGVEDHTDLRLSSGDSITTSRMTNSSGTIVPLEEAPFQFPCMRCIELPY